jgi:hypothetical protein
MPRIGLTMQLTSKVPDCRFLAAYHIDYIEPTIPTDRRNLTSGNSNKSSRLLFKIELFARNVRGGRVGVFSLLEVSLSLRRRSKRSRNSLIEWLSEAALKLKRASQIAIAYLADSLEKNFCNRYS